jgi:uncharacterized 2Fe-2S/4Fe-4S cluster protein (DUF4445 family)
MVQIELIPSGQVLHVPRGIPLQEILFAHGVEFPCGGRGKCQGCRIRFRSLPPPPTDAEKDRLDAALLKEGWRLACVRTAQEDMKLELAQWESPVLADNSEFHFVPQPGYGVAIDLGTTTLAAQLVDLSTGFVLAVATGLNPQAQLGADIMTRIDQAIRGGQGDTMTGMIRRQLGAMTTELLAQHPVNPDELRRVVIVGNTVMHHLFCGLSLEPLAAYPFETREDGLKNFAAGILGLDRGLAPKVFFLPCLGGFVGSDILAGIIATRLPEKAGLSCLIDLGTNGEIVVAKDGAMVCASTAAGPAFEGARISMGMRASTGAISEVRTDGDGLSCRVIGQTIPRGICGSGLVDAVAAGLELGWIEAGGRLANGRKTLPLLEPVCLSLGDVRELQLAKGAVAAGVRLLLDRFGADEANVDRVFLAGAFGNYINRASARRIGLWSFAPESVQASGNTALLGAKIALFTPESELAYESLRARVKHVGLSHDAKFEDSYIDCLRFPSRNGIAV